MRISTIDDFEDRLTIREKARRHLMTWSKKELAQFVANVVSDHHLEKWSGEYDKANDGR